MSARFFTLSKPLSHACVCCKALGHVLVSGHLALGGMRGFRGRGSCGTWLVQFVHVIIGGLGGAVSRGSGRIWS